MPRPDGVPREFTRTSLRRPAQDEGGGGGNGRIVVGGYSVNPAGNQDTATWRFNP
ncbi:MAG: hypothetical protein ACKVPX_12510 [Myxococcaceae bacterium]